MGDAAASPQAAMGKRRRGGGADGAGMKRVAEIVMVLAAAGEVRGGREPTAAERALVAEARERLAAAVSEGAVRPRDLFPGEAVRAVVEDLGLNRAKDPAAMGFRPPKASIADRLMLTKRKMEEAKEAQVQPTATTPQTTVSSGMAEFQGLHGAPMFAVGAIRNPPVVTSLPAAAPVNSASQMVLKPPGLSLVKPVTNPSVVALPHTGQPHIKLEKGVNGPLNLTRSGGTVGHLNRSFHDTSARSNSNSLQSCNQMARIQDMKAVASKAATGNPVMGRHATPGTTSVPTKPTFANHNEIAKNVQHILHQPANHPCWTPPSTEYMHACLDCQICKVAIMDADSLVVCDACERGAHLKCLQHYGNKGVPKADWHCPTCLAHSKGKPLPPKYGKVTRTVVAPQTGPPGGGTQLSIQGAAENMAANGNLIKPKSMQVGSTNENVSTGLSFESMDSANDTMHGPQSTVISGLKCSDNSVALALEAIIKSEAHPEALLSRDMEMVDNNGTPMDQTSNVATAVKTENCATFEPYTMKDAEMTTNTGTPIDQGSNVATEEKVHTEANSEPHTIKDVEMTTNTRAPIYQSINVDVEEKLLTNAISEPETIKDTEMVAYTATAIDQNSNIATEEKPWSEPTSAVKGAEMTIIPQIPTDQTLRANGSTENGVKEPSNVVAYKDKPDFNAILDHHSTHQVISNGVLHTKDEVLCSQEGEVVGCSTSPRE